MCCARFGERTGRCVGLPLRDRDEIVLFDPSETRTKESNICASFWVFKTHERNESKGWLAG